MDAAQPTDCTRRYVRTRPARPMRPHRQTTWTHRTQQSVLKRYHWRPQRRIRTHAPTLTLACAAAAHVMDEKAMAAQHVLMHAGLERVTVRPSGPAEVNE